MTTVTEPYMVHDQQLLAGKLACGDWAVVLREWFGDSCDLDTWKLGLLAHAEQVGVEIFFFDIPRKDMTLAANAAALPTFDQVTETVAAMVFHRWMEREIGSEMLVKTGADSPYTAFRR